MTIIDDVLQGVGKEFEKIQTKSQEIMQSYNLTNQIKDIERKRNQKLVEIGRLVCDKIIKKEDYNEDVLKDKANEVAGYDTEIAVLQNEVDQAKSANDPSTPASQRADSKSGYKPTPGFECPRCHAPASKDKKFCPLCGGSLGASSKDDVVDVEPNGNDK
jgi:hypothetical protein